MSFESRPFNSNCALHDTDTHADLPVVQYELLDSSYGFVSMLMGKVRWY